MGTALFIGTCRVIEPARLLGKTLGRPALALRHRLHNPNQVEQAIRLVLGEPVFDAKSIHLMSERTCAEGLAEPSGPERVLGYFDKMRRSWSEHDVFVVEISSWKDHVVDLGGRLVSVNTHAARDLGRNAAELEARIAVGRAVAVRAADVRTRRLTESDILAGMRRIKRVVGDRPIVWAGHLTLTGRGGPLQKPAEARAALAATLRAGAQELGDTFFDPGEVVRALGPETALADGGADLFHWTKAGIEAAADRYWDLCARRRARSGSRI